MQQLIRLCLWQVTLMSLLSISTLAVAAQSQGMSIRGPSSSSPVQNNGMSIRGPKSFNVASYEQYGPVTAQDTLWNIALKIRPDNSLTVYQVMQSLYTRNPQAFAGNNINHLVTGTYITVPSINEMRSIDKQLAKAKSNNDDKNWESATTKAKKALKPEELTVKKKDLDAAKIEINEKLQTFGNDQTQRLSTIQQDVLDSIDGLQALLKENEGLRSKLSSFNNQLTVMQDEVAKSKEIKLQMDDMLALQQALLDKADAREQALLLEKQMDEKNQNTFTSSIWFKILIFTLPTLMLVGGALWFFLGRKSKEAPKEEIKTKEVTPEKETKTEAPEEKSTTDDSTLNDELSLNEELSLDDELTIDLAEDDAAFAEDIDLLSEDAAEVDNIHLDEELDEIDDLEDLSLEGGELDQSDLDALLSGLGDEPSESEEELIAVEDDLSGDLSDPDDIDALMASVAPSDPESKEEAAPVEDDLSGDLSDPDDIDALMASVAAPEPEPKEKEAAPVEDDLSGDLSDPDDIDALMDSLSSPDDIDALMDSVASPELEAKEEVNNNPETDENLSEEITDSDDIDAFLESLSEEENVDINDSNDVDELLNSVPINDELSEGFLEDDISAPSQDKSSENKALIDNFTEESVGSFLSYDFSDMQTEENTDEHQEAIEEVDLSNDLVDELDIDSLINEISTDPADANNASSSTDDIDETLKAMESDFDEATLSNLLNETDDFTAQEPIELSPDFSDSNVLADLLTDDNKENEPVIRTEANELDDIQELDNLDFDELLLNIEEEISNSEVGEFELNDDASEFELNDESTSGLDIGDDLLDLNMAGAEKKNEENFITVDSLLSDSFEGNSVEEPYDKTSIDVGLEEFPEFGSENIQDEDDNGMEAKLDLAKVYIEIEDKENAEIILLDVVQNGDMQQQLDAQQLIDNLT